MAIIKQIKNKSNVNVSYWNIAYFEIVNGERVSVKLNGYLDYESREHGAEPVDEIIVQYETTKEGKFNYGQIYKEIKKMEKFDGAEDN